LPFDGLRGPATGAAGVDGDQARVLIHRLDPGAGIGDGIAVTENSLRLGGDRLADADTRDKSDQDDTANRMKHIRSGLGMKKPSPYTGRALEIGLLKYFVIN